MSHDVRAIANFVLDLADIHGWPVTNLSINKIVYFLHSSYLVKFGTPLVTAKIEAWEYGPVFRELYREFKKFGDKRIASRANRLNPVSGELEICSCRLPREDLAFLESEALKYLPLSGAALVTMSHVRGGPWDQVWNHESSVNAAMRISDDLIIDWHLKAERH